MTMTCLEPDVQGHLEEPGKPAHFLVVLRVLLLRRIVLLSRRTSAFELGFSSRNVSPERNGTIGERELAL